MVSGQAESGADAPLVQCSGVVRDYGSDRALDGVDITIATGESVAIVGPSGCGKSTLLNLLGAMDRPEAGQVLYRGQDLATWTDDEAARFRRDEVGFVFQFFNLVGTLNAVDNVALPARLAGTRAVDARRDAHDLLSRVGLVEKAEAYPDTLSGGQQQRVALARSLINQPRLLLADEPTGALDTQIGSEVLSLLGELVHERHLTLVMATHSEEAISITRRKIELRDGRVVHDAGSSPNGPAQSES
jgi:putative ABC transport system ATP-binding protein